MMLVAGPSCKGHHHGHPWAIIRFMRFLVLVTLLLSTLSGQAPPIKAQFDPAALEQYVRYVNLFDAGVTIKTSTPTPSTKLAGFKEVVVTASRGEASMDLAYFISADGQKFFQGEVFDVNTNPFADTLAMLQTNTLPAAGTPGAPVDIVVFSDFQCPVCKQQAEIMSKNLLQNYPKEVRLSFNHFPLEQIHNWARAGAIAGRCVHNLAPAKFWKFHDAMFEFQDILNPLTIRQKTLDWAKVNQMDEVAFNACYDNPQTNAEVQKEIDRGRALKVDRTPTVFINGRKLARVLAWDDLKFIVEYELKAPANNKMLGSKPEAKECCSVTFK
jgi:protein-disulfide isomerase